MLLLAALFLSALSLQAAVDFNRDVRPILSDNCFACHGPDEEKRMAGLRLDTRDGAFERKGVIVAGKSAESRIWHRITADKPALRMPPVATKRTLTPKQIETIKQWVDEGARWEQHWAFVPPKRTDPPPVQNARWTRNPIDGFVLARLEREGLHPSAESDRARLIRRVTFDLTGLPPTPAEVDAFLKDRSPDAYEKIVDRLLASPHYGERMAMQWLDVARYADTHGYHIDSHRDMWPWRDWVIRAFNSNMRFDRFTVEQLAGDLLPGATLDQRVATGFNRNHMINFEGGAIPEEYLNEYVADRVDTTSTVWLGLTMGCARCHDHKYDPIRQREYYQFSAFFNNVSEKGLDGRAGNAAPMLSLPTPDQQARLENLNCAIREHEALVSDGVVKPLLAEWEKTRASALPVPPRDSLWAHYELDGSFADLSGNYRHGRTVHGSVTYEESISGRGGEFGGEAHVRLARLDAKAFTLATWLRNGGGKQHTVLQQIDPANSRRGWEIAFDDAANIGDLKRGSHLIVRFIHQWPDSVLELRTRTRHETGVFEHVALTWDGAGAAQVWLDGKPCDCEVTKNTLAGSVTNAEPVEIGNKVKGSPFKGRLDDLRIYTRILTPAEIDALAVHYPIAVALADNPANRSTKVRERLRTYYLEHDAAESLRSAWTELKALQTEQRSVEKSVLTTMVMDEMKKPRETHVLARGDYRNRGEKVEAGVPAVLPELPKDAVRSRLTLARWFVNPSHPLTARVAVNRFWQMYFGSGLVKTSENFGSQSEPPSHPELLDWLATEFVRTGWDMKAVQRLIVTSATYRQASRVTHELLEKDPENRLLARGPRVRLPAEMIRDNALAVSGLMNAQIGGAPVFPYQPAGIWEELAFGEVYSAQSYKQSTGSDLYRRSMYTFWKRTVPPPALNAFDAPDREKCTARRTVTNTPLQALVLMNDPTYVEAARALAQRTMLEAGPSADKRITYAFRLAAARPPERTELAVLRELAAQQTAAYTKDSKAAAALVAVGESKPDPRVKAGELAAWTTVMNVILGLDETITKE
jgi:hypothetical protein